MRAIGGPVNFAVELTERNPICWLGRCDALFRAEGWVPAVAFNAPGAVGRRGATAMRPGVLQIAQR
jgi:hypothetical protein